jgi:hypothetical protein
MAFSLRFRIRNQAIQITLPFQFSAINQTSLSNERHEVAISALNDEAVDDIVDLLEGLCSITRLGCFRWFPIEVDQAAKIVTRPKRVSGLWEGELFLRGVHPAFWRVFLQMCTQYHHLVSPVDRIQLSMDSPRDPLSIDYPKEPMVTLYQVERIAIQPETPAIIRLDAESWSPENLEKVRLAFEDWGSVVFAGGFFPADQELELPQFDAMKVNLVGLTRLECVVVGWRSTESAIDTALSLCSGIHSSIQPLSRVEIE